MSDRGLYAALAGATWGQLPSAFCRVHAPGVATGELDVRRGRTAARVLAWLMGLPREGHGTLLALRVEQQGASQVWHRRFGETVLVTRQYERAGLLREQFGPLELGFQLHFTPDLLRFDQRAVALVVGPLRLPWPRFLSPRVAAEVRPIASGAAIEVEIRAPVVGLILRYTGNVVPSEAG